MNKFKNMSPRSKKTLIAFLFVTAFLFGTIASYAVLKSSNIFDAKDFLFKPRIPTPASSQAGEDSVNILLLGYGGAGHDGGNLSDSIIVVSLIPNERKASLISIPRDLWVKVPIRSDISQNFKINHAYAIGLDDRTYPLKQPEYKGQFGGGNMAKEVVGEVIGMPIDYFLSVDFQGLKDIVDTLDGVTVNVPVTFDDNFYPIKGSENDTCGKNADEITKLHEQYSDTELHHQFECRYERIQFEKGQNRMNGEEALKFVRSRASAQHGGDFARSQRQQALILGIKQKLLSIYTFGKFDELYNQYVKMINTDLDLAAAKDLIQFLGEPDSYQIKFIGLSDQNQLLSTKSGDGQFILVPKDGEGVYSGIHNFVRQEIAQFD
jgi:anionic cell wall polymer biosynthesis LytR-Cps2A-Psr (LCP) family protein